MHPFPSVCPGDFMQVYFNTRTFSGTEVHATEESELYVEHRNICRMKSLSPAEKREALHMAAERILNKQTKR